MLNHYKWNKELLYERFYENENHDELFRQLHLINPEKVNNVDGDGQIDNESDSAKVKVMFIIMHVCFIEISHFPF